VSNNIGDKLIVKGKQIHQTKFDKEKYPLHGKIILAKIDGHVVEKVPLEISKEVKRIRRKFYSLKEMSKKFTSNDWKERQELFDTLSPEQLKRQKVENTSKRYLLPSALVKDGKILEKGIQVYRHWFYFLKLALELESLNAELCTKQSHLDKSTGGSRGVKGSGRYSGGGTINMHSFLKIKVKRGLYKGWDLDQVLSSKFDDWFPSHKHLFEGHSPEVMKSDKDWKNKDNFMHVQIDKNAPLPVIKEELERIVSTMKGDFVNKWKIEGTPRVNNFQNYFNAVVGKLKGMKPKDLLDPNNRLIIKPDEDGDTESVRSKFTLSKDKHFKGYHITKSKSGKPLYSSAFADHFDNGINQLRNVCEGTFGKGLEKGRL